MSEYYSKEQLEELDKARDILLISRKTYTTREIEVAKALDVLGYKWIWVISNEVMVGQYKPVWCDMLNVWAGNNQGIHNYLKYIVLGDTALFQNISKDEPILIKDILIQFRQQRDEYMDMLVKMIKAELELEKDKG